MLTTLKCPSISFCRCLHTGKTLVPVTSVKALGQNPLWPVLSTSVQSRRIIGQHQLLRAKSLHVWSLASHSSFTSHQDCARIVCDNFMRGGHSHLHISDLCTMCQVILHGPSCMAFVHHHKLISGWRGVRHCTWWRTSTTYTIDDDVSTNISHHIPCHGLRIRHNDGIFWTKKKNNYWPVNKYHNCRMKYFKLVSPFWLSGKLNVQVFPLLRKC